MHRVKKCRGWLCGECGDADSICLNGALWLKCLNAHPASKESSSTSPGKSTEIRCMTEWESMRNLLWSDDCYTDITFIHHFRASNGQCTGSERMLHVSDCVRFTNVSQLVAAHQQFLMGKSFWLFSVIPGSMITVWDLSLWASTWCCTNKYKPAECASQFFNFNLNINFCECGHDTEFLRSISISILEFKKSWSFNVTCYSLANICADTDDSQVGSL